MMNQKQRYEHLAGLPEKICALLEFPGDSESCEETREKAMEAFYMLWTTLLRVSGTAAAHRYFSKHPELAEQQRRAFHRKCLAATKKPEREFMWLVKRMMEWEPEARK